MEGDYLLGKLIDLTGQKFGKLTVLKRVEDYVSPKGQIKTRWLCQCDCKGNNSLKIVTSGDLKSGHVKSCGCLPKPFKDLTGQKFGRLTVIKQGEDYISPGGHKEIRWWCQCECNGENSLKLVAGHDLKSGNTKSCGCLHRENPSKLFKKYNTFDLSGEFGIGYTENRDEFWFDLEDYDLIKDYYWRISENNYIVANDIKTDKNHIRLHRLVMNCPEDMEVDHKFHNRYDNRKEFLRIVTSGQNNMNMGLKVHNTSGVTGVCWSNVNNKWRAYININGKQIHLGVFDDFQNAVEVRKQAEIEYFGEYRYMGDCYQGR